MKKLELAVLELPKEFCNEYREVLITITLQTHRGDKFGENDCLYFIASNGVELCSIDHPNIDCCPNYPECLEITVFNVRGVETESDDDVIFTTKEIYKAISEAVDEYNEYFKEPYETTK